MRTSAFITCRLASSRLPRKHLLQAAGKEMLAHLIERIRLAKKVDNIIVCTTTNPEDSTLAEAATKYGADYFRGSEEDIIKRHYDCAVAKDTDLIVNVDGDDIFCSYEYIDKIIDAFHQNNALDIVKTSGLPFGMNSIGYKRDVLGKIIETRQKVHSDTGWGECFEYSGFNSIKLEAPSHYDRREIRATLDYRDDYLFFKSVIEELAGSGGIPSMDEIIKLIDKKPEIAKLNNHLNDEYWANFNSKKCQ